METKRDYTEKLAAKLLEWDERLDELKAMAEGRKAEERLRYRQQVLELRDKREQGAVLLNRLHEASGDSWLEIKKNADRLLDEVKRTFKRAA